jgi:hypothetical protein
LRFWASAEVFRDAAPALNRARLRVEPFLNASFASSSLATLDVKIRYVPIEWLFDCAPQLNCGVFVEGSFEDQLREYLQGIAQSSPHLAALGASPEQIAEFEVILESAVARIVAERLDQTKH